MTYIFVYVWRQEYEWRVGGGACYKCMNESWQMVLEAMLASTTV